ncbi:uncharacterized protein DUF2529 [Sinobaca qinghaiensis]|uniref:Uncharacterized protein DUF2529 n=1 Tax=Sinobaca qinghaiensis TaxID=342944 RepID=A0A419V7Y9_9BACL|nr:DUF2529 family protein [Sinobaca qinghaiensis]RKD76068.1 uncharacterized protein DUF2529 [Sinobaca qinghaiensis]
MKIFATQLQGIFQSIASKQEEAFEDASRLLLQAVSGTGTLYIAAAPSLKGTAVSLCSHPDAPEGLVFTEDIPSGMQEADRLLLLTDQDSSMLSRQGAAGRASASSVIIGPASAQENTELEALDVWLATFVRGGIVPTDTGEKQGDPASLAALFTGQLLFLYMQEMLEELSS